MESKHHLLSENMTTFMRQLLEDFDNPCLEVDNQASSQFQPRDVDINTVVQLGETIGRGRYGLVRKGVLLSTGEIVAVKIIQKNELQSRDVECILVGCDGNRMMNVERVSCYVCFEKASSYHLIERLLSE